MQRFKEICLWICGVAACLGFFFLSKAHYNKKSDELRSEMDYKYESGYEDGYEAAKWEMYDEYESRYDFGYEEGYMAARDEYKSTPEYDDGYGEGYFDGCHEGATYAYLSCGDIDRAFLTAKNHWAWYAFIDGYDEYVADIYSTDEQRESLYMAFAFLESATSEEVNLLISTFGKELFDRNGIVFQNKN